MGESLEPTRTKRFHFGSALGGFAVGLLLAGAISCALLGQVFSGIAMGNAMASGPQRVLHSVPSPGEGAIAYIISDDCGATCGCATRVDIAVGEAYFAEAFRSHEYCDLDASWTSPILLQIRSPYRSDEVLGEIDVLGLGAER